MVAFHSPVSAVYWCLFVQEALLNAPWPGTYTEVPHCVFSLRCSFSLLFSSPPFSPPLSLLPSLLKSVYIDQLLKLSPYSKEEYDEHGNLVFRGLRVRMGVHVGKPECKIDAVTGRMDYVGGMVNRAARITGTAAVVVDFFFVAEIEFFFLRAFAFFVKFVQVSPSLYPFSLSLLSISRFLFLSLLFLFLSHLLSLSLPPLPVFFSLLSPGIACGGQVFLSGKAWEGARREIDNVYVEHLGQQYLKGLSSSEQIVQILPKSVIGVCVCTCYCA